MDADIRALFDRSITDATQKHTGAALDASLADLGWHDALADEPRDAVSILFERQGVGNAASSALDAVVLDALGLDAGGIVLPALGQWRAPGVRAGDRIVVDGLSLGAHERLAVVAEEGDKHVAIVVSPSALAVDAVHGIDAALGVRRVRGDIELAGTQPVEWVNGVCAGQRALAHELIGGARAMLDLARAHALERVQFGHPIAAFQAIRHRLAETLVAIETADAALDAAWIEPTPVTVAMAKALAGRGARVTARHCQQVLAGIGFTTEHPLHRYIRRTIVLDQLLGSSKRLTVQLGEQLLASRQLPRLVPL